LFVFLSIAASCAVSTGALRAADDCVAKPKALAPPGKHWYYRTDRNFKGQCWYLAAQGLSVYTSATRATETLKQTASASPETPAASSGAPQPAATEQTGKPAAALAHVSAPADAPDWPDATGGPDEPPSLWPAPQPVVAEAPRAAAAIAEAHALPVYARSSGAAAATLVQGDHAFALIILATVLLAIAGPVIHAARRRRQRRGGDREELGAMSPSIVSRSDARAPVARAQSSETALPRQQSSRDQTEDVAQTLQRLINEMETRRSARPKQRTKAQ
jgi:hypothetical protein